MKELELSQCQELVKFVKGKYPNDTFISKLSENFIEFDREYKKLIEIQKKFEQFGKKLINKTLKQELLMKKKKEILLVIILN